MRLDLGEGSVAERFRPENHVAGSACRVGELECDGFRRVHPSLELVRRAERGSTRTPFVVSSDPRRGGAPSRRTPPCCSPTARVSAEGDDLQGDAGGIREERRQLPRGERAHEGMQIGELAVSKRSDQGLPDRGVIPARSDTCDRSLVRRGRSHVGEPSPRKSRQ